MKKITALLLALMMVCLCACSSESNTSSKNDSTEGVEVSTDIAVSYPLTVTDQAGRKVTLDKEPKKIVSGYYISTSLLLGLGLEDRLVGVEAKADKRQLYKIGFPKVINLPSVGTAKEFNLEGCAALEPDLVILPLKLKDSASTLEQLGIKTILVNPEDEELLNEMIDIVSTATNTKEKAQELLKFTETNKKMLEEALKSVEPKSVYLAGNSDVLSTAGGKMYQSSVIKRAGGKNVAESIQDTYWATTSYEQILAWNPDYIVIAADATYSIADVKANPALANCNAVKNGNIYRFPSDVEAWDSPVPSGILGSIWLTSMLHPDVISDDKCESIMNEYYESFYKFKYNGE